MPAHETQNNDEDLSELDRIIKKEAEEYNTQVPDETIKKERELFDNGILLTPSFVLDVISAKAEKIANADFNLVFSGSPRTLFEAFGDENHRGLIEILEKHYGKENTYRKWV